jgi:nicotinamidase/pyrazinamidase
VVLTQDWHPPGHFSFASTHPGKNPFETIAAPYGPQVLWPDHCVQGTPGAAFHPALQIPHAALLLRKGMERMIDSYSAFYENDHKTPTGLVGYLHERGVSRVFLAGLAFDFCVRYSAEDARREGFTVFVIEDACRAIDLNGSTALTHTSLASLGIACISRWRPRNLVAAAAPRFRDARHPPKVYETFSGYALMAMQRLLCASHKNH